MTQQKLKQTPLNAEHRRLGARMVDFGGWDMPVQYSGVLDEHKTVRTTVGLFDVSHMGELMLSGRGANDFLQRMVTNDISKIEIGQAQYSAMCNSSGCVIDDIIIYRRGLDSFLICVNASNIEKDEHWLRSHLPASGVVLENESESYAQIAVQGPKSRDLVQQFIDINISNLKYYWFAEGKVLGQPSIIARTGYTGELGYELYVPAESSPKIWAALVEAAQRLGGKPCGLGARDTLRLEMGYLLYGNDMDETTTALECGLGWVTKLSKGDFIGSQVLVEQKQQGAKKTMVGIQMVDKAIARHGYKIFLLEREEMKSVSFQVALSLHRSIKILQWAMFVRTWRKSDRPFTLKFVAIEKRPQSAKNLFIQMALHNFKFRSDFHEQISN